MCDKVCSKIHSSVGKKKKRETLFASSHALNSDSWHVDSYEAFAPTKVGNFNPKAQEVNTTVRNYLSLPMTSIFVD